MLRLNYKKFLVPLGLLLIYLTLALLVIPLPELRRPWLIVFGVHCVLCVVTYVSMRIYLNKRKELIISPEEMAYLKARRKLKVIKPQVVKQYHLLRMMSLVGLALLSALPLVLASIEVN